MGSVNASQIPEEQHMWTDIWNWRKKYYYPEDDDSWWKEFVENGIAIGEKYATKLSHEIILQFLMMCKIAVKNRNQRRY